MLGRRRLDREAMHQTWFGERDGANLKHQMVQGSASNAVTQVLRFVLQMGSVAILARLLTPDAYGVFALSDKAVSFLIPLAGLGLGVATVQEKRITHEQTSTLFWMNLSVLGLISLTIVAIAPLAAMLYGEPRVMPLIAAMGAANFLNGLGQQHRALLMRTMRLSLLAYLGFAGFIFSQIVTIAAALMGLGYWALFLGMVANGVLTVSGLFLLCPWVPSLPRRGTGAKRQMFFGANITAADQANRLSRGLDQVLVGVFTNSATVGLYDRATTLLRMPMRRMMGPITSVAVPGLSAAKSDDEKYRRVFFGLWSSLLLAASPVIVGLVLAAHSIVLIILGEQWLGAGDIFLAMMPAVVVPVIAAGAQWLMVSQGRGADRRNTTLFTSAVSIASFFIGIQFGVIAMAWCFSLASLLIGLPVELWVGGRKGPVTRSMIASFIWRYALLYGVAIGGGLAVMSQWRPASPWLDVLYAGAVTALLLGGMVLAVSPLRKDALKAVQTFGSALPGRKDRGRGDLAST
ncbi:MAG: lipopolysaccharide biosynthesis protein [Planctomycetota bacterium]